MSLADNLLYLRKENNLSQEKLAEELKVSRQAVGKWEAGSDPELAHVKLMCDYFKVDMHTFVYGDVSKQAVTVSQEITISVDNSDVATVPSITQAPPKKNRAKQYRAIRTTVAIMLFILFPFWPRTIPYDIRTFLGIMGFIIGIGLLIYNRLTRAKKERS